MSAAPEGPLADLRVIDVATILAGPMIATNLADFGAEVIKVEHPRGDSLRAYGWNTDDGASVHWKVGARNKRTCTLNFGQPDGQALLRRLVETADVLIENFRPGVMEKWGLDPASLLELNPRLVIIRVTGFGQDGPYSPMPGFGTLAEAMSGLASILGHEDRPPIVPPFPMADAVTSLYGTYAALIALRHRDHPGGSGAGQVIDLNLLESMVAFMAPLATAYDALGIIPTRNGSQMPFTAPRNVYGTSDGQWIAISTSAQSIAERLLVAIGRPELRDDPRFATNHARLENRDMIDDLISGWIAERTCEQVLSTFREHDVAVARVYTAEDIVNDEHLRQRGFLRKVEDGDRDPVLMHEAVPRLSDSPGQVRHAGRDLGADNFEVFGELGLSRDQVDELHEQGIV
jgi:crotonobetainyl-CoA:carnitine CoA-transferase CaiB-like acyl-CoA transferase